MQEAIMRILALSIACGYTRIPFDIDCVDTRCSRIQCKLTVQQHAQFDSPITDIELQQVILHGDGTKSPGAYGISLEFYRWG
jgi:hypothetical protein